MYNTSGRKRVNWTNDLWNVNEDFLLHTSDTYLSDESTKTHFKYKKNRDWLITLSRKRGMSLTHV